MSAIDVKKHVLVPKHSKISEKEKGELFKRYKINGEELPIILKTDPAIEELDVKQGDIIKIFRKSATAKTSVFYRVVMNA
ncbi:MAG: DNA-directed RNA polymerase subunit H [Candidatus Woesearchaeota archaeon]